MIPYFVSYGLKKDGRVGFGSCHLDISRPVSGWDDIEAMTAKIRTIVPEGFSVAILGWRRFEEAEEKEIVSDENA
jgi:hypothetical protein